MQDRPGAPNIRPAVVLRRRAAGRGPQRRRHAPGRSGALDAVARTARRRQGRRQAAGRLSLADDDPRGRLQARHRHCWLPRRAEGQCQERRAQVILQHLRHLHAAGRAHLAQRALGLGSAGWRRRHALHRLPRHPRLAIEARQTKADGYKPEVYIVPNPPGRCAGNPRSSQGPGLPPLPPSGRAWAPR